jgi:magnesium transporter
MSQLSPDIIDELLDLVEQRQDALIQNILPSLHPADMADVMKPLDAEARRYLFDLLGDAVRSEVLVELDPVIREELVQAMAPPEIGLLVGNLDSDDAADLVGELEDDVQEAVLAHLDHEDAADIRNLLTYEEDSAGGIMAAEYIELPPSTTVEATIVEIRRVADEMPTLHFVYVVDEEGNLLGRVSLRSLLLASPTAHLLELRKEPKLRVHPDMDQEDVARAFRQYDVVEAPVVSGDGAMLGVITVDDVVDVIEEEATEDLARIAGTEGRTSVSVLHASGRRLPWLLVGLVGGLLAALALSRYELSLKEIVSLAFFIPVINAMGGNVAMQSSSIAVRGLAVGPGIYHALGRQMLKEFLVSVLNGLVCGVLLAVVVGIWLQSPWLALLIGIALFTVILIATTVGALVPVLLDRMKIDPALAAGPFVTTANDVLGILIYLSLADVLLPHLR